MKQEIIDKLRTDLHTLHDDWEMLLSQDTIANDPKFLEKIAEDIQKLDADATLALGTTKLKEQALLFQLLGAPPLLEKQRLSTPLAATT